MGSLLSLERSTYGGKTCELALDRPLTHTSRLLSQREKTLRRRFLEVYEVGDEKHLVPSESDVLVACAGNDKCRRQGRDDDGKVSSPEVWGDVE